MGDGEKQYWQSVGTRWTLQAPQRTWRAHSDAVNAALLGRWLPCAPHRRLLKTDAFDEAVSAGLFPQLSRVARTVIAIDISTDTLAAAARRYDGLVVVATDLRSLPFADGSLDGVVSLSSLDHFESIGELVASLRELHRVLSPGGYLILTLDNLANPLVALRNALPFPLLNRLGIVPYRVGQTVGPGRLRILLESAGFEVQELTAIVHAPRVFAVALANLVDRIGMPRLRRAFLAGLSVFERLSRLPTRFLTGYFVAVRARRPRN